MDHGLMDYTKKYRAVIGLEVHAQLLTESKIFASDSTQFGAAPNTQISTITLAHPGTLPKLNKKAFEYAIKMGLACGSTISRFNGFDRKNYFYPDLPKGYQITQNRTPVCVGGQVATKLKNDEEKNILLNRIHLEEDAGKSMHVAEESDTLLDFNRAGVPLIEIVTEPAIHSSEEAYAFLTEVRKLVRYLEICDGNMEEGSLRCDANISIMLRNAKEFGKKVEVKNMNSIRNVQRAVDTEINRQIELLERGEEVISETRTFDAATGLTHSMRMKEELNDYRYFPDPDLSPVIVSDEWLNAIEASMPVLPRHMFEKFTTVYQLSEYDATVLTDSKDIALFFDVLCQQTDKYKAAANWIMGPVKFYLNELTQTADEFPVPVQTLAEVINLVESGKVNFSVASQRLFPELIKHPEKAAITVARELNLIQDSDADLILPIIEQVLLDFPDKVTEYKKGKTGLLGMFMGEVKKRSRGKANPKVANDLLIKKLNE
jgi:aspartyl-tRNA(Asn)/glutamyl-tRNA(Gln) amidotransferase subunit B